MLRVRGDAAALTLPPKPQQRSPGPERNSPGLCWGERTHTAPAAARGGGSRSARLRPGAGHRGGSRLRGRGLGAVNRGRGVKGQLASELGGQWPRRGGKQRLAGAGPGRGGGAGSSTFPAAPWGGRQSPTRPSVPAEGPRDHPPSRRTGRRGDGGGQRRGGGVERGVRTSLAATGSRRLRPHRRGVGAGSRGDPEGPARLPWDGAPTGPGEQEWLGPSPAPGSSLLPAAPAPPLPGPGDFNPWRQSPSPAA